MAASAIAARLTDIHRLAQARLGADTVVALDAVWPLLDVENLDSFERWLAAATRILIAQKTASARLAANYLTTFKTLEVGGRAPVVLAETLNIEQATTSLLVTGPYSLKKAIGRGVPLERAVDTASARAAAAGMRLVLNGGRDTILDSVRADRQAQGWARVASGAPCAFCAMLASRGPVYDVDTADFEAHDHCSCSAEPVYRSDSAWPAGSERFHDLWQQAKAADGDTTANFRQLVEAS